MVHLFETSYAFNFPWPAQVYAVLNKYPNPQAPHVVSIDVISRTILDDGTIRSERLLGLQQDTPKWVNRMLGSQDTTYCREVSFIVPSSLPNPNLLNSTTTTTTSSSSSSNSEALRISHLEPPKLLMASTNLTLSHIMQCRESISYLPLPWPHVPKPTVAQLAPSLLKKEEEDAIMTKKKVNQSNPSSSSSSSPINLPKASSTFSTPHSSIPPTTLFSQSALIFTTGKLASSPYPPIGISKESPIEPKTFPEATTLFQRMAGNKIEQWAHDRFLTNAEKGRGAMEWAAKKVYSGEGGGGVN